MQKHQHGPTLDARSTARQRDAVGQGELAKVNHGAIKLVAGNARIDWAADIFMYQKREFLMFFKHFKPNHRQVWA